MSPFSPAPKFFDKCRLCGTWFAVDGDQKLCVECWKHIDCCGLEKL